MKQKILLLLVAALTCSALAGCAGKRNRYFVGQCSLPGHWFCGKVYDSRADCNNDRKRHDYETSMSGSCFSGDSRGSPDTRSM
ncbi:MAG: hypothetical protein AB8B96_16940 [Lysobacterales bacterium]